MQKSTITAFLSSVLFTVILSTSATVSADLIPARSEANLDREVELATHNDCGCRRRERRCCERRNRCCRPCCRTVA